MKHNASKGSREPLKMLRIYNKMFSYNSGGGGGGGSDYLKESSSKIMNDMGVAVYGDMGALFRRYFNIKLKSH